MVFEYVKVVFFKKRGHFYFGEEFWEMFKHEIIRQHADKYD